MKLEIDVERWQRGENGLLATSEGSFCAIGFLLMKVGIPVEKFKGLQSLVDVVPSLSDEELDLIPSELRPVLCEEGLMSGDLENRITDLNDDGCLSEDLREELLVSAFAEAGIELTFCGDDTPPF